MDATRVTAAAIYRHSLGKERARGAGVEGQGWSGRWSLVQFSNRGQVAVGLPALLPGAPCLQSSRRASS